MKDDRVGGSGTSLAGKVAIVTGAGGGLGRSEALALARAGASVVVNDITEGASSVVDEIEAAGGKALLVTGDVGERATADALLAAATEHFGGLHILVNNAGIAKDVLIFNMEPEDWRSVMDTNFGGVFNCTKAALSHFMSQREGVVVNVSSVMGERGWVGQSNYAASKGAINAFTRTAAVELARFGIRVNAVLPGFAPTDLVAGLVEKGGKGIKKQLPMQIGRAHV